MQITISYMYTEDTPESQSAQRDAANSTSSPTVAGGELTMANFKAQKMMMMSFICHQGMTLVAKLDKA